MNDYLKLYAKLMLGGTLVLCIPLAKLQFLGFLFKKFPSLTQE